MGLISTRIPDDTEEKLMWFAKKEQVGKAIALRKIIERGLRETRLEHAIDLYKHGRITLWKSAEIAGISLWDMLQIVRERRIPMKYTLKDVEKDLEIAIEFSKKIK